MRPIFSQPPPFVHAKYAKTLVVGSGDRQYERWGGMPLLRELGLREPVALRYLQDAVYSIFMRDVLERYRVRHPRDLENLAVYLAYTTGSPFSQLSLSQYFKNMQESLERAKVLENMVHTHLLAHGFQVRVGAVGSKEVDFVAERNVTLMTRNPVMGCRRGGIYVVDCGQS